MALSVAQLYEVMTQLPDPVFILSEDGHYIEYIGGVEQQSYQDGNPLIGKRLFDVLPADKALWVMEQVARALAGGQVQVVEYDLSPAEVEGIDAEAGPQGMQRFEGKIAPLPSLYDGKRAVAWMTRNITRQHELQLRLKRLGETDQLTGLYNRHFFFDQYHQRVQGQPLTGLIMLDLDHFKQINDRYGHGIGDNVLQEFSALLCQHCPPDGVVARLGGEEFAIWLPGMLSDKAQALAEQIRAATEALVACEEIRFTVSIAVGIGQAGEAVEALVKRTDLALYRAKHLGRNRVELA